jgi:hypothetical protein
MRTQGATEAAQTGDLLATEAGRVEFIPPDPAQQAEIVDALIRVVGGLYAHLPLKRAMYGIDPVQQLRRLEQRLASLQPGGFHRELGDVIRSLRDAHTVYVGPKALAGRVARLPFLIEVFEESGEPRYMVSKVAEGLVSDPDFKPGVELEWWNGAPVAAAIDTRARSELGGRPDSGRARAVESLTFRSLRYEPAPDEQWVVVGYRTISNNGAGASREVRIPWTVITPEEGPEPISPVSAAAAAVAVNPAAADVRRAKKLMFNPTLWRHEVDASTAQVHVDESGNITGRFADNVSARIRQTPSGEFGHLRIWGFDLADDDGFINEVIEICDLLPQGGLVVDLRANPGGLIWAAERLLQLFTPDRIEPCRFSLLATESTRRLAALRQNQAILGPWLASLTSAMATGELYSQALPITPVELCNNIGQVYSGPVVAVVDATTYSAGDLFAAGFVDNGIGRLVTVGEATGAGGANVWSAETLTALTVGSPIEFRPLPGGAGFTVSIRRATRVGASAGLPIEDIGVGGHLRYSLTRDDLVNSNVDLFDYCGALLASTPKTAMKIDVTNGTLDIATVGLNTVDIYADGHPIGGSITAKDDHPVTLPLPAFAETLEVRGFKGSRLKQRRVLRA